MFNSLVDTFINLDVDKKNMIMSHAIKILNPIKLYLFFVLLLLLLLCISNYFIYIQISKINYNHI